MSKIIVCKHCGEEKRVKALGLCENCYKAKYYRLNKEKLSAQNKQNGQKKRKEYAITTRKWREEHRKEYSAWTREYKQSGKRTNVRIVISGYKGSKQYWVYNTGKRVHIAIVEKALGRRLKSNECTHHIDGNGLNNLHSNLMICTKPYHTWLHHETRRRQRAKL